MGLVFVCLLLFPAGAIKLSNAAPGDQTYWNIDPDFSMASQQPLYVHHWNAQEYYAPWGNTSWGVIVSGTYNNRTSTTVDEYVLNVTSSMAYVWSSEDRRIVDPRVGGVGLEQGLQGLVGSGPRRSEIPAAGRDTIIAYRIKRVNSSISYTLNSIDESAILFDLIATTDYTVNGTLSHKYLVIDFYIHQECGPLNGPCNQTNNTSTNHLRIGSTHFFEWRIHRNLQEGVWVSDIANLRWYIENSLQRARCLDATGNDNCDLPVPQGYISGLTASTEAFGGSAGFALDYLYVLQSNDCLMRQDAGSDFSHASRINNLTSGAVLQVNGWLGSGNLYKDSDDFYRFNVTPNQIYGGYGVYVQTQSGVPVQLYAPGERPALRASANGNNSLSIRYNFLPTDPSGDWYLRVYGVDFGAYSLNISLYQPPNPPTRMPVVGVCSPVSPAPEMQTPWVLVGSLTVLAAGVILGGRYGSRRWKRRD